MRLIPSERLVAVYSVAMEHEPVREKSAKAEKRPLYLRLYQDQAYMDIVRIVGYGGIPATDANKRLDELSKTYGRDKLARATEELTDIIAETMRLKAHVRTLAFQILGLPPDYKVTPIREMLGLDRERVPEPPKPQPKKVPKAVEPAKVKTTKVKKSPAKKQTAQAEEAKSVLKGEAGPIMKQYRDAKEKHPDMILIFRMGDFYEMFDKDAELAAKVLGLTLTTRDRDIAMAGFPHHSLEAYLHKLLHAGHRVAICDQVDESLAKGPIKR